MPNLALSQATATAHFDRFLLPDRLAMQLYDLYNLLTRNDAYIIQDGGYSAGVRQCTAWTLNGIKLDDANRNTDADGRLWIRLTANGGDWDVHLYKATGAGGANEVASATAVADGAVATLAEVNSSGITGTCTLAAAVAAIAADTYSIRVFLGWPEYARQIFNGANQEDGECLAEFKTAIGRIASSIASAMTTLNRLNESGNFLKQLCRIWQVPEDAGFLEKTTENNDDVITALIDGALHLALTTNWAANTTVQKVAVNTIAIAAATEAILGGGDIAVTFGTPGPNLEPGTLQAVCVEDAIESQRFRITFTPTDGTGAIVGRNLLTVGKVWDDPDIPIQITATNVYLLGGTDGGDNDDIAAGSNFSFTGATSDNTDDGKLYWIITASSTSWIVTFYKDSSCTQAVAVSPATATGAVFTATQQNRSGLTVVGKVGSGPTTLATGWIDMQPLKKGNSTTDPDQFYAAVTRSALGRIQDAMREFHKWKVNSGAAPTFADTFLDKSGRFTDGHL